MSNLINKLIDGTKKSRTIKFQMIMAALDVIVLAPQAVFEPIMPSEAIVIMVLVLSAIHKAGNVILRYKTSTPLT